MKHRIWNALKEYGNMLFKDGFRLMKKAGLGLLFFELIYKLFFVAAFYPVLILTVRFTLKKAGFNYLTNEYFTSYIKSPYTMLAVIILLLILICFISYEMFCLSVCFDAAWHGEKMTAFEILKSGTRLFNTSVKKKKLDSICSVTLISLMMNITLIGYLITNIKLNSTKLKRIYSNKNMLIIMGIILIVLFIICLFHIFTMNYMTYGGTDISDCRRKSRRLFKQRGLKTFLVLVGWNAVIIAAIYIIYFIVAAVLIAGVKILDLANASMAIYLSVFRTLVIILRFIMVFFSIPVSYGIISGMFYRYRNDDGNEEYIGTVTEESVKKNKKHIRISHIFSGLISVVLVATSVFYMVMSFDNNPFKNVEIFSNTAVMAHRGASAYAPENTMAAFQSAIDATADYIELDVHETKDGRIVVLHDSSLKRTTGVDKQVYELDYEDIRKLDAGSFYDDDGEFVECYIPTLEEVMQLAQGEIKLNIEIKLSSHEPDLVSEVVRLVQEYNFTEDCYVTSMSYLALTQVKAIDENIKTGYTLKTAYGNFYNLKNVDAFSINLGYVDKNVIDAIHNHGKEVFVWLVNGKNTAKKLTSMGVDAILTDDPVMGREVVYSKYSNPLISNVLSYVFKD